MLVERIRTLHVGHKRNYGAIRVHKDLRRDNYSCSRRRVNRLMKQEGIESQYHAVKYKKRAGGYAEIADNLLADVPKAARAGEHWAGDMTYLKTEEGPIYMAAVLDLFNREVIGWAFSRSHDADLVCSALEMSLSGANNEARCLFHSDQGSEYRSDLYRDRLKDAGIISSMSRAGTPTDNAYVESFFGTLKNELVYHWKFRSAVECVARVVDYLQFYNEERLHSGLDYMSPGMYQKINE